MKTIKIIFSDKHEEKMLMHKISKTDDIVKALQKRHTLHIDNPQIDIEDYFNEGYLRFSDAITGSHIVSVMW